MKSEIRFYNDALLIISIILETFQVLIEEMKIPSSKFFILYIFKIFCQDLNFWFNENENNLQFMLQKISENDFNGDYKKVQGLVQNVLEIAKKKLI